MKKKYTFIDLSVEILSQYNVPMSPDEIWQKAIEIGLDKKIGTTGKTPFATIGARLYTDIKVNGEDSMFFQVTKRPARFVLRNSNIENREIKSVIENKQKCEEENYTKFNERDLHPLLAKYVYANQHFKCYVKTIFHEKSHKKSKGVNEWLHPDLVGVYFPFGDYNKETTDLQKALNVNSIRLFSFEMKKELNYSNLRECFFQAVSNSSWANEGFLVSLKIDEDPSFRNEIQRLSNSFGIGIIKLNSANIYESEIICTAQSRDFIDWDTLDRLAEDSPDFKTFISDIKEDLTVGKVKSNYDEIKSDEDYDGYVKKKGIQ